MISNNQTFQLGSDEPWDTMKAQLLVQIEAGLKPPSLNFDHYTVIFYIPHILPKPGMPLSTEADYDFLQQRAHKAAEKDPAAVVININIVQKDADGDKENTPDGEAANSDKTKKS
jgi:hypothetical protein